MIIIQARYRDLPWKDIVDHFIEEAQPTEADWEENYRGQPVIVCGPGHVNELSVFKCEGPLYSLFEPPGAVCPHIAEVD